MTACHIIMSDEAMEGSRLASTWRRPAWRTTAKPWASARAAGTGGETKQGMPARRGFAGEGLDGRLGHSSLRGPRLSSTTAVAPRGMLGRFRCSCRGGRGADDDCRRQAPTGTDPCLAAAAYKSCRGEERRQSGHWRAVLSVEALVLLSGQGDEPSARETNRRPDGRPTITDHGRATRPTAGGIVKDVFQAAARNVVCRAAGMVRVRLWQLACARQALVAARMPS